MSDRLSPHREGEIRALSEASAFVAGAHYRDALRDCLAELDRLRSGATGEEARTLAQIRQTLSGDLDPVVPGWRGLYREDVAFLLDAHARRGAENDALEGMLEDAARDGGTLSAAALPARECRERLARLEAGVREALALLGRPFAVPEGADFPPPMTAAYDALRRLLGEEAP